MSDDEAPTRTQTPTRVSVRLRLGTKICLLVGLSLLAVAAYFYYEPLHTVSNTGGIFGCGSASDVPTDGFAKGVCGNLADVSKLRTFLFGGIGLMIVILGSLFFGVSRTEVPRTPRGYISEDGQFRRGTEDAGAAAHPGVTVDPAPADRAPDVSTAGRD